MLKVHQLAGTRISQQETNIQDSARTSAPNLLMEDNYLHVLPRAKYTTIRSIPLSPEGSVYAAVPQSRKLTTAVAASTTSSTRGY